MYDRAGLIALVESAIDTDPFCPACYAPTDVVEDQGGLYLSCSAAAAPTGPLARIGAALFPHLRVRLLESEELLAV